MPQLDDVWTQRGLLILALLAQLGIAVVLFVRMDERVAVLERYAEEDKRRVDDHINLVTSPVLDRLTRVEERQQSVLRILGRVELMLQGHLIDPSSKKMFPKVLDEPHQEGK
jgi:hypothetical protein